MQKQDTKPYAISRHLVMSAYERVKSNQGSAGVDGVSLSEFDEHLKDNLYKIWNRMSSGSYSPPAVELVEIPKSGGGVRPLGIPTVGDRVSQMAAVLILQPLIEPCFHPDSYAYRNGLSAHAVVASLCDTRCEVPSLARNIIMCPLFFPLLVHYDLCFKTALSFSMLQTNFIFL